MCPVAPLQVRLRISVAGVGIGWLIVPALAGDSKKKKKKKKPKKKKAEQQSEPPRVGLTKLFPDGNFPEGELQEYKDECVPPLVLGYESDADVFVVMHGARRPRRHGTTSARSTRIPSKRTRASGALQRCTGKSESTRAKSSSLE